MILSARLGSCVVQSLRTARTSFEMIFEQCMFSLFFVAYTQAHLVVYILDNLEQQKSATEVVPEVIFRLA